MTSSRSARGSTWNFFSQPVNPGITGGGEETPSFANALRQNHPNPFNPQTTIRFELAEAGPVTLAVFDAAGRLVRTLIADNGSAAWDGRDGDGRGVHHDADDQETHGPHGRAVLAHAGSIEWLIDSP